MGIALKGKNLEKRRAAAEASVKKNMNADMMNYLAYINYTIQKNRGMFIVKSWVFK